jgi:uncharacterized protein YxjI
MKKQFYLIANKMGVIIDSFKTYRSEEGCQVYSIQLSLASGRTFTYDDSYFVGEESGKGKVLKQFEREIKALS